MAQTSFEPGTSRSRFLTLCRCATLAGLIFSIYLEFDVTRSNYYLPEYSKVNIWYLLWSTHGNVQYLSNVRLELRPLPRSASGTTECRQRPPTSRGFQTGRTTRKIVRPFERSRLACCRALDYILLNCPPSRSAILGIVADARVPL